jgi:hypothetical protein
MPRLKELKIVDWHSGQCLGGYAIVDIYYLENVGEGWIFNGRIPQGLVVTEEDDGGAYAGVGAVLHRKFAGPMRHEDLETFRREWDLDHEQSEPNLGMLTEYGLLPGDRFNFDGMDWNVGGVTPILCVDVSIFDAVSLTP